MKCLKKRKSLKCMEKHKEQNCFK